MTNTQFTHTTSQDRESNLIVGSIGGCGLYVPQDFIPHQKREINRALDSLENGLDDDELTQDNNNNRNSGDTVEPPLRNEQAFILSEEANLLRANGIAIEHDANLPNHLYTETGGDSTLGYGSIGDLEEQGEAIRESWDDAVKNGNISTNVLFELKSIFKSSIPLVTTFVLQNSFSVCSIFVAGRISSEALAGITLGAMTANITAIAAIDGLASCLDTFLPQAYGAKKYHLVGLVFQRCVMLIFTVMTFICIAWWIWAEHLLLKFLPDKQAAFYASQFLKINSFGIPGYILFETGKRFLQSQGIFDAATYILFICAPLNVIMNYTFVWIFGLGYIGAPIAVSVNYTLMAVGLYLYTVTTKNKINPMKCWTKFEIKRVFRNWGELIKLAIPDLVMIMSEFISFEALTLFSSYLGTIPLAAQSILATMAALTCQVPYGASVAASTRIANFLGAQLATSAFIATKASLLFSLLIGFLNFSFLYFGRYLIANLFSTDTRVVEMAQSVLPLIAVMQLFDAFNIISAGCLRGQGLQAIGGYVNLFSYYVVGLPLAAYLGFRWPNREQALGLLGLWLGSTFALFIISSIQTYCSFNADFNKLVDDANERNDLD